MDVQKVVSSVSTQSMIFYVATNVTIVNNTVEYVSNVIKVIHVLDAVEIILFNHLNAV